MLKPILSFAGAVKVTDLDRIKSTFRPFLNKAPALFRGMVQKYIDSFTYEDMREIYTQIGGDVGVDELAAAIKRVGKGESTGLP